MSPDKLLSKDVSSAYTVMRHVPDQGWCGVHRLMYHWTVHVGITEIGYEDRWCFETQEQAIVALATWTGKGDMPGDWHKHPATGRRRDPVTGQVWDEKYPRPVW